MSSPCVQRQRTWLLLGACLAIGASVPPRAFAVDFPPDSLCLPPSPTLNLPTAASPWSVALGDLNGDGFTDIVAACEDSAVSILIGTGAGAFEGHVDYPVGKKPQNDVSPRRVAVGDLNADGISDLAITDAEASTVTTLLGVGDGTFSTRIDSPVGAGPYAIVVGDFNEDGLGDLVTANSEGRSLSLLLSNRGSNLLQRRDYELPLRRPTSLAPADYNGDGHLDVAIATDWIWSGSSMIRGTLSVLLGNGDGTFQPRVIVASDAGGPSIIAADIDSDGIPDLVSANSLSVAIEVRRGLGDGSFEAPVMLGVGGSNSVAAGDLNNDGNVDVVLNGATVLLGHGDGTFGTASEARLGDHPSMIALGDVNQDGRLDIVSTNTGSVALMLNRWVELFPRSARAFTLEENRPLRLVGSGADVCFQVEPEGRSEERRVGKG